MSTAIEDCDHSDQEIVDQANEFLRAAATAIDAMRAAMKIAEKRWYIGVSGGRTGLDIWEAWFAQHSGGAPVEDWLDHQWAYTDFANWPEEAKQRLADVVYAKGCSKCGCPLMESLLGPRDPELCEHCGDYDEASDRHWRARVQLYDGAFCDYKPPEER